MKSFKHKESIEHESAKHKMAQWLSSEADSRHTAYIEYPIVNEFGNRLIDDFETSWHFNNSLKSTFPLCYNNFECEHDDSELFVDKHLKHLPYVKQIPGSKNWCPTFQLCIENKLYPVAIVDIVVPRKGAIYEIWEIKKTSQVTQDKLKKLADAIIKDKCDNIKVYEISSQWILKQDVSIDKHDAIKLAKIEATIYNLRDFKQLNETCALHL